LASIPGPHKHLKVRALEWKFDAAFGTILRIKKVFSKRQTETSFRFSLQQGRLKIVNNLDFTESMDLIL
jgi:hypothetical protein